LDERNEENSTSTEGVIGFLQPLNKLEVVLIEASLFETPKGFVGGRVYLRMGERVFPDETWFDYPIPVLERWLESAFAVQSEVEGSFLFMEGPFRMIASPVYQRVWHVKLIEDRLSGVSVVAESLVVSGVFLKSLLQAAEVTVEWCCAHQVASSGVQSLESRIERLLNKWSVFE
jgi:hypothetical protein